MHSLSTLSSTVYGPAGKNLIIFSFYWSFLVFLMLSLVYFGSTDACRDDRI